MVEFTRGLTCRGFLLTSVVSFCFSAPCPNNSIEIMYRCQSKPKLRKLLSVGQPPLRRASRKGLGVSLSLFYPTVSSLARAEGVAHNAGGTNYLTTSVGSLRWAGRWVHRVSWSRHHTTFARRVVETNFTSTQTEWTEAGPVTFRQVTMKTLRSCPPPLLIFLFTTFVEISKIQNQKRSPKFEKIENLHDAIWKLNVCFFVERESSYAQ